MSEGQGHAKRRQDDVWLLWDDWKLLQELYTELLYGTSQGPSSSCAGQLVPTAVSFLCVHFIADGGWGISSSWRGLLLTAGQQERSVFTAIKAADGNEDLTVDPGQQRQSSSRRWWRFISKLCSWETQRARLIKIIHFNGIIKPWPGMFKHLSMFKFVHRTWKRSEVEDGLSALPALLQVLLD